MRPEIKLLFRVSLWQGYTTGNSEIPGGLGVLMTNGFNGQEQLRAAVPVLVQLIEGLVVSPEARPDLPTCSVPGSSPRGVACVFSVPLHTVWDSIAALRWVGHASSLMLLLDGTFIMFVQKLP